MRNLFQQREVILHSGSVSEFKIECDALTDDDLDCLAYLVSKKIKFCRVIGIGKPFSTGRRFAAILTQYTDMLQPTVLIADDVLTTGKSMEDIKYNALMSGVKDENIKGVVIFARKECPTWIQPILKLWEIMD